MQRLLEERKSPWVITLTKPVPVAFDIPLSDWLEGLSCQSEVENSELL